MQKRIIIWWFLILQMICFWFVETNINIAIVSMVTVSCANNSVSRSDSDPVCPTSFSQNDSDTTSSCTTRKGFAWSESEQNLILSGSTWLSYISMMLGALLAEKFGPKRVIGISLLVASIASSLIPVLAYRGPFVVACIRAFQGFFTKLSFPAATMKMIGSWCPPQERARFQISFYLGSTAGNFLSSLCFGYISEYINWQYVFYVTSIYGIIISLVWFALVYDSPQHHPTISSEERIHIKYNADKSISVKTIPWRSIFTNIPFIVCLIAYAPRVWLFRMLQTYLPSYFKTIYGFHANQIGILLSIWHLTTGVVVVTAGYTIDITVKRNILSITNTRKLAALLGSIFPSMTLIVASYAECHLKTAIVCLAFSTIFESLSTFGPALVVFDLSPQYCGILTGIVGTVVALQVFLLSLTINYFSDVWNIEELWRNDFLYTGLYVMATNALFLIFGTAEQQRWNYHNSDQPAENKSAECIRTETDSLLEKKQYKNSHE